MINYEQEVKKIHDDAECIYLLPINYDEYMYWIVSRRVKISDYCFHASSAWQSAYEKLKKEGKI
jgi:hypothetical protein